MDGLPNNERSRTWRIQSCRSKIKRTYGQNQNHQGRVLINASSLLYGSELLYIMLYCAVFFFKLKSLVSNPLYKRSSRVVSFHWIQYDSLIHSIYRFHSLVHNWTPSPESWNQLLIMAGGTTVLWTTTGGALLSTGHYDQEYLQARFCTLRAKSRILRLKCTFSETYR